MAGRWLRVWVVTDAVIVLCAGVLTGDTVHAATLPFFDNDVLLAGITSASELLAQLAHDHVLPRTFLAALPYTKALYVSILSFVGFSGAIYASTGANLVVVSKM